MAEASTRRPRGRRPGLVLPLHGHLAPAAWAAAQARPGLNLGYVQTGGGALPGSLSPRRRRAARARPARRPHHRRARLRRRARGAQHVGALDAAATASAGTRSWSGPGPGIIGSEHRVRPRRHGRPRQRPRRPLPELPTLISPRLSASTRASATATSATTPTPSSTSCSPRSTSPSRRATTRSSRRSPRGRGGRRHRLRPAPVDLDAYAASGLPTTHHGPRPSRRTPSSSRPLWRPAGRSSR